ncbi:hypothetical protein J2S30_000258 [Herbaspirillum rubrisubalbicans]|nr:hypothetical protein [Herbaspirillum rubrisubalbicans]
MVDVILAVFLHGRGRGHHAGAVGENRQEGREGRGQLQLDGVIVHHRDLADVFQFVAAQGSLFLAAQQVELHRLGVEGRAILELDPFAQVERVGLLIVGNAPALGQHGDDLAFAIQVHQLVEDTLVEDALVQHRRLRRIELAGIGVQRDVERHRQRGQGTGGQHGRGHCAQQETGDTLVHSLFLSEVITERAQPTWRPACLPQPSGQVRRWTG